CPMDHLLQNHRRLLRYRSCQSRILPRTSRGRAARSTVRVGASSNADPCEIRSLLAGPTAFAICIGGTLLHAAGLRAVFAFPVQRTGFVLIHAGVVGRAGGDAACAKDVIERDAILIVVAFVRTGAALPALMTFHGAFDTGGRSVAVHAYDACAVFPFGADIALIDRALRHTARLLFIALRRDAELIGATVLWTLA